MHHRLLQYFHKTTLGLESFGPLKIASCDPVILYNMFIIVIYQDDRCLCMPHIIYPEFTVKSLMYTEKNMFCLDDSNQLHYGTAANALWEHAKFKTFPYSVLSFCIISKDLLIIHSVKEDLILTQLKVAKGFRKVKDTTLDSENVSKHDYFTMSCHLITYFSPQFISKTLNLILDDSNKESYIIFIHAEGKVFWLVFKEDSSRKVRINLLYEAVLPLYSLIAFEHDILLVLRCGTLIFVSTNNTFFLNDSIENFDNITDTSYVYTSKGHLYYLRLFDDNEISGSNIYRFGNINNIHNFMKNPNSGVVKIITGIKSIYSVDAKMFSSLETQPQERYLMLPKDLEKTKDLVACLKNEVFQNERSIDKITIEKHLILLSALMLKMNVFEKTVKIVPNLYDSIQDLKSVFRSCLIFEPLPKMLKTATSVLHVKIDFSLEFKVRFNEINRVLMKSRSESSTDIWNINLSLETSSCLKQISYRLHNLENLNIIISMEESDLVLPIKLMSYLVLNYSDCQTVLSSNYTYLNIFDVATQQTANGVSIDESIVRLASQNVGLLYTFEREPANHRSFSFRLSIHRDLFKDRNLFMKHLTKIISERSRSQIGDLLIARHRYTYYVHNTEIALEITEDDASTAYFEANCKSLILLQSMRSFLLRALQSMEETTVANVPLLKLVEHANYARFENARRDLNESILTDTLNEDKVLKIFMKLNEDLLPRLPL